MLAVANLDVLGAGNRRARLDQVDGIEHARAVLALVAARALIAAMRTSADDVAVGQKPPIRRGVRLLGRAHVEQAVLPQRTREMVRQFAVLLRRGASEMIPRQSEAVAQILLHLMPLVAIVAHGDAVFRRGELYGRAVFVGGADRQRLVAARPAKARENVRRQHRADEISQMLDAVDALGGAGDENAFHEAEAALFKMRGD